MLTLLTGFIVLLVVLMIALLFGAFMIYTELVEIKEQVEGIEVGLNEIFRNELNDDSDDESNPLYGMDDDNDPADYWKKGK